MSDPAMPGGARIAAIEVHFPERVLTSAQLSAEHPEWPTAKIEAKTGVVSRHIAAPGETPGDLAFHAAQRLFESGVCRRDEIDFLLLCTQQPDHLLPATACLLQDRLGLRTGIGALDFNLGCSGFVYGLALVKGLVETGQASCVLLLNADTFSRILHPDDKSVRTLFGDAATATLVRKDPGGSSQIGPFLFGTDGRGAAHLGVRAGGARHPLPPDSADSVRSPDGCLFMDGGEVFAFTLEVLPAVIRDLLARAGLALDDVDRVIFHQANAYMLEHLRKKIGIPSEKFVVEIADCGNTVSTTIPIALKRAVVAGVIKSGHRVLLAGYGVGYSWAATLLRWS